jgi:type I restriction enzyme R subunit
MRPIFSPTDFIQIKGRGTRKYTFTFENRENGEMEKVKVDKENFKLFDFFANCEYFEEKYNYDEILKIPKTTSGVGPGGEPPVNIDVTIGIPDPLKTFQEKAIGLQGMKVDRKIFEKFEETVKADSFIKEKYEAGDMQAVEDYVKTEVFDKPEDYFNLDKLRKSVKVDRRLSLREIMDKIFGRLDKFKDKDELLEEEFEKFISIYKPDSKYYYPIKNFLKAYITDNEIREIVETKEYGRFATNPKVSLLDFKALNEYRDVVPEYVKDYVSVNTYM